MYATNYFEDLMLNLMRGQNIAAPSAWYLALFMSNPTDTGTAGTEVSYAGYARQAVTFTLPAASGDGQYLQNGAVITFPEAPNYVGDVTYIALYDNLSGGNMWLYGQLDEVLTIQSGVSPIFRAGNIKWFWSGNLSTYYRKAIMRVLRGENLSGFSPYVGFCNGDPTGSGNEFSGNNYARVAVTMTAPSQQSSGTDMVTNTDNVSSPVATGNWGVLNTVAIYDAATSGNVFAVIPLGTSYTINTGYAIGIKQGNLQFNVN